MRDKTRRDFFLLAGSALATLGLGIATWPFIASMNPSKDALARLAMTVNLSHIRRGQELKVIWQGVPIYIHHRTTEEVRMASQPRREGFATDRINEVQQEWTVIVGVCTHEGCVVLGADGTRSGPGWYCPCCGSQYDIAGRVINGPAHNLAIPSYQFTSKNEIVLG